MHTSFPSKWRGTLYRGPSIRWHEFFLIYLPASLAACLPLLYGWQRYLYGYTHYGPLPATAWSQPWYRLSGLALLPLLLLVLRRLWRAHNRVAITPAGLVLRFPPLYRRKLPWSEIAGLATWTVEERFLGLRLLVSQRAVLYPNLGRPIHLSGRLANLPALVGQIQAILYPRLLPSLQAEYRRGRWVHFGPLALSPQAIQAGRRRIPQAELSFVGLRSGCLVVESTTGQRLRLPVTRLPNLELFFQLISKDAS